MSDTILLTGGTGFLGTELGKSNIIDTSFSSLYERSKAKAETLVRASSLPFSICRPRKGSEHEKENHYN